MSALVKIATQDSFMSPEKEKMIRDVICKGASPDEISVFLMVCRHVQLDPIMKQIYLVPRWDSNLRKEVYTAQTSIDGFRLIADRTGKYSPGPAPTFSYDKDGNLISATSYIKKQTDDKTWHTVEAIAFYSEYVQKKKDGTVTKFWYEKPHLMLAKCFDSETEVLTEFGFKKFSEVNGRIMQVTENGIEPVYARPFVQDYSEEMVAYHSEHLDFCVTPNHDMMTTSGKIEAGLMYDLSRARPSFFIPRIAPEDLSIGLGFTQAQCELAAAILCDGDYMSSSRARIKVSKPHKIGRIRSWNLHSKESIRNVSGKSTTHSCGRTITTKNDQIEFCFDCNIVEPLVRGKRLDHESMIKMNSKEAKWFIDSWIMFDGNGNSGGGVDRTRRIWSSDKQYISQIEVLAIKAGYCVSPIAIRKSDISIRQNLCISLSDNDEISVSKRGHFGGNLKRQSPSLVIEKNNEGKVWCVTVPSSTIIVRRKGFSFLIHNCAESLAFRKAFPNEFSNLHTEDELSKDAIDVTPDTKTLSREQLNELYALSVQLPDITEKLKAHFKIESFLQLDPTKFEIVRGRLLAGVEKLKKEEPKIEKVDATKVSEMQLAMDGE